MKALVCGGGGFIGGWLTRYLQSEGWFVRGVDIKYPDFTPIYADEFLIRDLAIAGEALNAVAGGFEWVFQLAADMGGIGYLAEHDADMMRINTRINLNVLEAARQLNVERYFFSSSACIYPDRDKEHAKLSEEDAHPADPSNMYGWEKLYTEKMCRAYTDDYGLPTRVARFHNVFGEYGPWSGGREKAPAAMCRKIAVSKLKRQDGTAEIEVWGDGSAMRSYLHVGDAVEGIYRLMESDFDEPVNIGSENMVSVKELAFMVADVAGVELKIKYIDGPVGVRARNANIDLARNEIGWEPTINLIDGLTRVYQWIEDQVHDSMD